MQAVTIGFGIAFIAMACAMKWDEGYNYGIKEQRQKMVFLCNEKPEDCKKEYEFYKLQKEVQTIQKGETK